MSADTEQLAVIGSPSTCDTAVLNLRSDAYHRPLLGHMLAFDVPYSDDSVELALGTVTKVETINRVHSANAYEALHIAKNGPLDQHSGDAGDARAVVISVEAVFRLFDGQWRRHSSTLSNSPATGTPVRVLDQETADELMADTDTPAYVGTLRGSSVRIPITLPDFSGPRGSRHTGVFGATGSGKSVMVEYMLSCMLRWPGMGHIIFDPQGQFALEHGLPFSLQGLAAACGRAVHVARLSQSLRLRKDAPLFLQLLTEAKWFKHLAFGAGADENIAQARDVLHAALQDKRAVNDACRTDDWTEAPPETVMRYLLNVLHETLPAGTIYAGSDQQQRVARTIYRSEVDANGDPLPQNILNRLPYGALDPDGNAKFDRMLTVFSALHSLWSPYTPSGVAKIAAGTSPDSLDSNDKRRDAWGLIRQVMDPPAGQPAPLLVLDLSADLSHMKLDGNDADAADDLMEAGRILDSVDVKARIMSQLRGTLKLAGQQAFNKGGQLNVQAVIDEAWQYAGPADASTQSDAVMSLSNELAGDCRDVRKLGIGFTFILQATTGLRDDIWRQLGALLVGYGLHDQADMKRLSGRVPDAHLALYRSAPPPEATGRYTWMMVGGNVTGLSFGSNPVFLEAVTDPQKWLEWNQPWISSARSAYSQHLPAGDPGGRLTGIPPRPATGDPAMAAHASRRQIVDGHANAPGAAAVASAMRSRTSNGSSSGQVDPFGPSGIPPVSSRWATRDDEDLPPF
ncbi:MAG: ATP-binding protein [Tomitella sp.]|nr:ATP-binding protein [Tomitella sp.]